MQTSLDPLVLVGVLIDPLVLLAILVTTFIGLGLAAERTNRKRRVADILAEEPVAQSPDVANLGIAIATLEAAIIDYDEGRSARRRSPADDVLAPDAPSAGDLGHVRLLRAQSEVHEVLQQVDQWLGHLPEADAICATLLAIEPPQPGGPLTGDPVGDQIDAAQANVRGAIRQLEAARARVLAHEQRSELVAEARAEAEAIEAARQAGTSSATVRDKERS